MRTLLWSFLNQTVTIRLRIDLRPIKDPFHQPKQLRPRINPQPLFLTGQLCPVIQLPSTFTSLKMLWVPTRTVTAESSNLYRCFFSTVMIHCNKLLSFSLLNFPAPTNCEANIIFPVFHYLFRVAQPHPSGEHRFPPHSLCYNYRFSSDSRATDIIVHPTVYAKTYTKQLQENFSCSCFV